MLSISCSISAFQTLSSIAFETVKSQTKKKQRNHDFEKTFFHIQVAQTFENLEIDFGVGLKKMFLINY